MQSQELIKGQHKVAQSKKVMVEEYKGGAAAPGQ